jgi:serine/threonine protein kinase
MNRRIEAQDLSVCPNRETLLALSLGQLRGDVRNDVEHHIEGCDSCLAVLQSVDDGTDPLIADLRGPIAPEGRADVLKDRTCAEVFVTPAWRSGGSNDSKGRVSGDDPMPDRLGDYRLVEPLGRGGMGTIYRAVHARLDRVVALKVLRPDRASDQRAIARFRREMSNLGGLDHPNLVRALDAREELGIAFLVMEYIEGLDLARLLEQRGPFPIADACEVVRQAAIGLEHAYRALGLVHRDVKPSNLMITPSGCVKVLDLGIACLAPVASGPPARENAALTDVGERVGTGDYMAPEQWLTSRGADIRADVYGMGCTLYELLAGRAPYAREEWATRDEKMLAHTRIPPPPIRELRSDIPAALVTVIDRLLAKRPADRYATPAHVARALEPFTVGHNLRALLPPDQFVPTISVTPDLATIVLAENGGTGATRAEPRWWVPQWDWSRASRFAKLIAVSAVVSLLTVLLLVHTIASRWHGSKVAPAPIPGDVQRRPAAPSEPIIRTGDLVSATLAVRLFWFVEGQEEPAEYRGRIGDPREGPQAAADDSLRYVVEAIFGVPLFPYLILVNPDGTRELQYPEKDSNAVSRSQFQYPTGDDYLRVPKEGLLGVVVLGSYQPLSSAEVLKIGRVDEKGWSQIKTRVPWLYDGERCEPLVTHREGSPGKVSHGLKPLTELGISLSSQPGIAAVRIVAFPVYSSPKNP